MFSKIIIIPLWVLCLLAHWAFIQNDFFYSDDEVIGLEEEDIIEINFDPLFFLCWLMGLIYMTKELIRFL